MQMAADVCVDPGPDDVGDISRARVWGGEDCVWPVWGVAASSEHGQARGEETRASADTCHV